MKKILAIILASLFILTSLISCGKKQENSDGDTNGKTDGVTEESLVDTEDCNSETFDSTDSSETEEKVCTHTGGTATCKDKAVCSLCSAPYGEVNPENHIGTLEWNKTATTHKKEYSCCGAVTVAEAEHKWTDGICTECGYEDTEYKLYKREGNIIYFGEYPQTLKADTVEIVGTVADARGYYLGSDNAYYAKVVASPYDDEYSFSTGGAVENGKTYYFKVEPIKWRILSETSSEAVIFCDSILLNKAYDASSNVYAESDISEWLTSVFFATAFREIEKELIKSVSIDGIDQKVFLLSEEEAFKNNATIKLSTTDYARANGACMSTSLGKGNGIWWLRNSEKDDDNHVKTVNYTGGASNYELVNTKAFGVVPAIKISL